MGMYDQVTFACPKCEGEVVVQSKAGDCHLTNYEADEVPAAIADDIENEVACCDRCDSTFTVVRLVKTDTIPMGTVKK